MNRVSESTLRSNPAVRPQRACTSVAIQPCLPCLAPCAQVYDRRRFTEGGIRHYELYFPDGSCPSEAIILKFLEIAEAEPGALAIHCKVLTLS